MTVATVPKHEEPRIVLENIRWSTYEALLEDIEPGRGVRIFFDNGTLEIIVLGHRHEHFKRLLGRFVETLTLELGIPIHSLGSATWKRALLKKGFEADESYYIANVDLVPDPAAVNVEHAPPIDLTIEVDLSSTSLEREAIYAAFKVREIWRHAKERVGFRALGADGKYSDVEHSVAFPFLSSADINRFLAMAGSMNETDLLRKFQEWVREHGRSGETTGE